MRRLSSDNFAQSSEQNTSQDPERSLWQSPRILVSILIFWFLTSFLIILYGSLASPLLLGYTIIIGISGLYLGVQGVLFFSACTIVMSSVVFGLNYFGVIQASPLPEWINWLITCLSFGIGTSVAWSLARQLQQVEITLQKRNTEIERALQKQEQAQNHLDALLSHSPAILYTLDSEARFTLVHGRGLDLPDLDTSTLTGQSAEAIFGPAGGLWDKARQHLEGRAIHEFRNQSLQTILRPIHPGDCISGLTINITQQAQAQAILSDNEARFRSLAENSPDIIAIFDIISGTTLYHNRESLLGHSFDQPQMLVALQRYVHPTHQEKVQRAWGMLTSENGSGQYRTEYQVLSSEGHYEWIENRGVVLSRTEAGQTEQIMLIFSFISERKRVEQALTASAEKLRVIFNETLDVVLIIDASQGLIREVNPAIQLVLGYEPNEIIGQHYSTLLSPDTQDSESFLSDIRYYGTVFSAFEFLRFNGERCQMDISATVIPWEEELGVLVTMRDTSERERLQQQVQAAQDMHRDLERQQEDVAMRENFISVIAHQLRTPLAVIQMSADILKRYQDRLSPERNVEQVEKILSQTHRMTALMNDLLLVRQGIAGKLLFMPRRLVFDQFFEELIEPMQLKYADTHQMRYTRHTPISEAMLDHQLMTHIIDNLLTNAIKYTPDGGEIRIELTKEEAMLRLDVVDTGIGIPAEAQSTLFEMFYRASNVGNISGNGLGLTIVRDGVLAHGGEIELESHVGVGTRFIIRLPYIAAI